MFVDAVVGGTVPKEYIPAVENGIIEAMQAGIIGGYPVLSYHDVDSSEMAFKIAGSMAFKDAMRKSDPLLLEPIMKVDVTVPEEYMGDVIGDLNSRRGKIDGMDALGSTQVIHGYAPLAEMFGYATNLRSRTQGRGVFAMEVHHYEPVPKNVQQKAVGYKDD